MRVQHLKWTAAASTPPIRSAQTAVSAALFAVVAAPSAAAPANALTTVPAGTPVKSLTLDRVILHKGKIGDSVNATVAFPSPSANSSPSPQAPMCSASSPRSRQRRKPSISIHFTRMTYPSGYIVIFDAVNTADLFLPTTPSPATYADASFGAPRAFGPNPAADPAPQAPPNNPVQDPYHGKLTPGEKTTILILGPLAFFGALFSLIFFTRRTPPSAILFDSGWQFQMTTQTAFNIDTTKVIGTAAAH